MSIIQDGAGWSRKKSLTTTIVIVVVAGVFINLGYNGLSFVQPLGEGSSILDLFSFVSNSVIMPIVALITCVFVGWILKPQTLIDEVRTCRSVQAEERLDGYHQYVAPVLVTLILVAYVGAQFGIFKF